MSKKLTEQFGKMVQRRSMKLIGISGRTNNEKELKGQGIIPEMWGRFFSENLAAQVPNNKGTGEIIAAYYDIDSDDRGPYRFFIGVEVESFDEIPSGMMKLEVPSEQYLCIATEKGALQTIGIQAWMKIWASDELRQQRKFLIDLEVYGAEADDPENAQFNILIGVK